MWKSSLQADRPVLDPTQYGWQINKAEETIPILPVMVPENIKAIPQEILKIVACNCRAAEPCAKGNCSCRGLQMSCTLFCKCYETRCCSIWTLDIEHVDDHIEDEDNVVDEY